MDKMFCFQCEQTAGGKACRGNAGACGKSAETAVLQDELVNELIAFSREADLDKVSVSSHRLVIEGLFTTLTNVNFDDAQAAD